DFYRAAALFTRQVVGTRGFRQTAQAPPKIQLPRKCGPEGGVSGTQVRSRWNECAGSYGRPASARESGLRIQERKLVGARNAELRPCLLDALGGNTQIEVVRQRLRHHRVHRVVGKQALPLAVANRVRARPGWRAS